MSGWKYYRGNLNDRAEGLSTEEDTDTVKIMLHPNGISLPYIHTARLDSLQVPRQGILMNVDLYIATARTWTLRAEKIYTVNKKHAFLVSDCLTKCIFLMYLTTVTGENSVQNQILQYVY
jgi:hypothetical protein